MFGIFLYFVFAFAEARNFFAYEKRSNLKGCCSHMQFTETEDEENEELDSETLIEKQTILALFTDDKNDDY
jgi:hypothetical protein